jgi:pheromone shutdown-related protein TraB
MSAVGHVTTIHHEGREIHIVGTAHVSRLSVEEVERVIEEVRPDTVCVELDQLRHEALMDDSRWSRLDVFQIIKQKKVLFLLTNLALAAHQKKLGERFGVRPGAELLAAVRAAERIGAQVVLSDRDVQATLKRAWGNLSLWQRSKLISGLIAVPFIQEEISEEELEALKDRDTISEMLEELAQAMPGIKGPLIDERDLFLMDSISHAPGQKIVAVVGAGHVKGMLENLGKPVDREALSRIPPPSKWGQVLGWLIPTIVLLAFYQGWSKHAGHGLLHMIVVWVLTTGLLSGLFTIFALGRPLTVLSAVVAAPITTLNPAIGVGMITGLVEAWLRRPTVADCQKVAEVTTIRAAYRNPVTRVLLVFVLSSVGAALGAWIGTAWVVSLLS